jgi:hypothetical protein
MSSIGLFPGEVEADLPVTSGLDENSFACALVLRVPNTSLFILFGLMLMMVPDLTFARMKAVYRFVSGAPPVGTNDFARPQPPQARLKVSNAPPHSRQGPVNPSPSKFPVTEVSAAGHRRIWNATAKRCSRMFTRPVDRPYLPSENSDACRTHLDVRSNAANFSGRFAGPRFTTSARRSYAGSSTTYQV